MLKSKIGNALGMPVNVTLNVGHEVGPGLDKLYSESGVMWFLVNRSKKDVDIVVECMSYDNMQHESRETVGSLSEDIVFSFLRFKSGSREEESFNNPEDGLDGLKKKGAFVFVVHGELERVLQNIRTSHSVGSSSSSSALSNPGFALVQDVCKICLNPNVVGEMYAQVEAIGKMKDFEEYKKSRGV